MALSAREYQEVGQLTIALREGRPVDSARLETFATALCGWSGLETPEPEIPSGDYPDEVSFDPRALAGHFRNRRTRRARFRPVI